MLCVYSSKDEIKPRCHLGLWLIKNGSIKNTKCLVTVQTSYSSQIRSIQTRRSTPDAFHYFQLRYIFQTIVFSLKYAIEFISIHFFLHTSTCGDNFQTKYGIVIYKRRIYEYYNMELQKWVRICLVDEELELPKYKRIGEDIEQIVIEYFADGKRYKDICDILKDAGLTTMDIHRIFEKHKVFNENVAKIKLEKNQPIYISIDDGHRKFWEFKRKINKYSMRLVAFYTDNINHKLVNKRVNVIIRANKTAIGVKKTVEFILEQGKRFFENFEQAKIIICGNSAGWIKEVANYLDAQFVLDKFHLIRTLYLGILAGNKGKYFKEYNTCKNFIENGHYDKLINYLYQELDNHKKLKKQYFKNNKQGIINQSAKWNIGTFAESNIWHILKEMLGNRTYNINIYIKMAIFKCNQINLKT